MAKERPPTGELNLFSLILSEVKDMAQKVDGLAGDISDIKQRLAGGASTIDSLDKRVSKVESRCERQCVTTPVQEQPTEKRQLHWAWVAVIVASLTVVGTRAAEVAIRLLNSPAQTSTSDVDKTSPNH